MEIIKILDLDEHGVLEFTKHPQFKDSIRSIKLFDNGFGVSIICKCEDVTHPYEKSFMGMTSGGSWEEQTFEIACVVGDSIADSQFVISDDVCQEYPQYDMNGGVLSYLDKEKVVEFMRVVQSLPTRKEQV